MFNLIHFLVNPGPVEQIMTVSARLIDLAPLEMIQQQTSPRSYLSHLFPKRLPREHLEKGGKIVLLVRNPRDTMVSHMYHTQKHDLFSFSKMSWPAFFDHWINGRSTWNLIVTCHVTSVYTNLFKMGCKTSFLLQFKRTW